LKYKIIFIGLNHDGTRDEEKILSLARVLNVPQNRIEKLIESAPVVIKKGVDHQHREKYMRVLTQAGAICEIKPEELELGLEPTQEEINDESPQLSCPQCGADVAKPGKCESCVAANATSRNQKALHEKLEKKKKLKEGLQKSFALLVISWAKGNIWKAAIVFILIPVFGSGLILSTAFYTQDRHLIYQTFAPKTVCVRKPDEVFRTTRQGERMLIHLFGTEFTSTERKDLMQKWNDVACRARFDLEMGNVGDEPIATTNIEFSTWRFAGGSNVPPVTVKVGVRNLSSSSPREKDPLVKQSKGKVTIENIYPNTLVTLSFTGWLDGKDSEVGWDRMMTDINVDEGVIDVGSPSSTAFARLLTIFF
jgi:hypothetical protein